MRAVYKTQCEVWTNDAGLSATQIKVVFHGKGAAKPPCDWIRQVCVWKEVAMMVSA